jgi:protein-S-isoprenylcysteine O-methyltransferase Ste14
MAEADATAWLARRRVALGFLCGAASLWLARPTWTSWTVGCAVALAGETLRVWAAGHLEKNRDVAASGPYRLTAHPLYAGSTVMGAGFAIVAAHPAVAVLIAVYLGATITAAIRREDAFLRARFGDGYAAYKAGRDEGSARRFSLARALRNREHRAAGGLVVVAIVLALRVAFGPQPGG